MLDVASLQELQEGEQSSEPKMESSGPAGGELSAPSASGSSSKPGGSPTVSYSLLPSKPLVKLDTPSATPQPSVSSSLPSTGDRTQVRRTPSPIENLLGSPRRYGDGESRSTSYLTSSDILKGPRPYQPWDVADLNICHVISFWCVAFVMSEEVADDDSLNAMFQRKNTMSDQAKQRQMFFMWSGCETRVTG